MNNRIEYKQQNSPDLIELKGFLETSFAEINPIDSANFTPDLNQTLSEWFDADAMISYLADGALIEARDNGKLIGAAFIGKQHPISWPDGKKAELFVLAVHPDSRKRGVALELLTRCEEAAKNFGAAAIIVNTNSLMLETVAYYKKYGYSESGVLKDYYDNGDAVFLMKKLHQEEH